MDNNGATLEGGRAALRQAIQSHRPTDTLREKLKDTEEKISGRLLSLRPRRASSEIVTLCYIRLQHTPGKSHNCTVLCRSNGWYIELHIRLYFLYYKWEPSDIVYPGRRRYPAARIHNFRRPRLIV